MDVDEHSPPSRENRFLVHMRLRYLGPSSVACQTVVHGSLQPAQWEVKFYQNKAEIAVMSGSEEQIDRQSSTNQAGQDREQDSELLFHVLPSQFTVTNLPSDFRCFQEEGFHCYSTSEPGS